MDLKAQGCRAASHGVCSGRKITMSAPQIPKRETFFVWQPMCNENAFVIHPDRFGTIENRKKSKKQATMPPRRGGRSFLAPNWALFGNRRPPSLARLHPSVPLSHMERGYTYARDIVPPSRGEWRWADGDAPQAWQSRPGEYLSACVPTLKTL
jgi:hypothetical protein